MDRCTGHTNGKADAPTSSCGSTVIKVMPVGSTDDCCGGPTTTASGKRRIDWLMWGSGIAVAAGYVLHLVAGKNLTHSALGHFSSGTYELMNTMWWGLALGILFVGLLDRVPRDVVIGALAGERRSTGILRATVAGVMFDLCSHGILMIGMKLYERGATIGQTVAFLLASPWNSLSLTVILISLIGWGYTLAFVLLSALIAIITGWVFDAFVASGHLPDNPNRTNAAQSEVDLSTAVKTWLAGIKMSWSGFAQMLLDGFKGSRMVLRWLFFGVVLAAGIRAFMPADAFATWFGPTMIGLFFTILAATVIEVCSEGSAPIAADLITRAGAPGNGFTFLMAGVATDYTEIMSLKSTTGSWKLALMLPVISVPQTIFVAILLNYLA